MSKKIVLDCQDPRYKEHHITMRIPVGAALSLVQALQFAIEHKEQFQKEITECEDCFESIKNQQEGLGTSIQMAMEHIEKNHPAEKLPN